MILEADVGDTIEQFVPDAVISAEQAALKWHSLARVDRRNLS